MARKALIVGVNAYRAPVPPLRGCLNDARQVRDLLRHVYQFPEDDTRLLLDEAATRDQILAGLDWLVDGAQAGDVLLLLYSGHGSQVDDDSGDEWECRDEILIPYDHDWARPLRDDHLKARFDRLPPGANLTFVSDSCHSGTVNKEATPTEVPRVVLVPPEIQQRIAAKVARRNAEFRTFVAGEYQRLALSLPPDELDARIGESLAGALARFKQNRFQFVDTDQNNILLAACQDVQTSTEALVEGEWHGVFTYHLVQALRQAGGALSYAELIARTSDAIRRYVQVPQLECPDRLRGLRVLSPILDDRP